MERRRFARIPVNLMLKFKNLERLGDALDGSACDLSRGGICISTDHVKSVGTRVEIEIPIPDAEPVMVQGTVRSLRYNNNQPVAMGIEFDELRDPALGVIQFLINKHSSDQ